MARLATDIGGTFTDLVYFNEETMTLEVAKALTTPSDLTQGIANAIEISRSATDRVDYFIHGGTTVINTITERTGAVVALVVTKGTRDVLEIARGNRPNLYNLRFYKEKPFVPRELRFEVDERVNAAGEVVRPLAEDDLEAIALECRRLKVGAVAVQFLHSYVAPEHEERACARLRELLPGVPVTASSDITREWREYERANTAVLNAYVQPIMQDYLNRLSGRLEELGLCCNYAAMQSNGGTTTFVKAAQHPITLVESGPAAGVNGAALIGRLCEEPNLIYLDIGGTTAKCATIRDGAPSITTEYHLERSRTQFGYPVRVPVVDIVEIGAGGGSIASIDAIGGLKVGPKSAGADPGPACYGRGGKAPTVTDAKLVTGVINPANFADGQFELDMEAARAAIAGIADKLGIGVEDAAVGIIRVVDASMINALKLVSIQRGHDPREFSLVIGGGGGPMHAAALGRELGVKEVIIPAYPGLFSAWGMLATEPRCDFVRTQLMAADTTSMDDVRAIFDSLLRDAEDYFVESGLGQHAVKAEFTMDVRYHGQEHAVNVPVDPRSLAKDDLLARFHEAHERTYTFQLADTPIEYVTFRITAIAEVPLPELRRLAGGGSVADAEKGVRTVHFGEYGKHDATVWERSRLPAGAVLGGPAIIEEPSSTTIVLPGQTLSVDAFGFLRIRESA